MLTGQVNDEDGQILVRYRAGIKKGYPTCADPWATSWDVEDPDIEVEENVPEGIGPEGGDNEYVDSGVYCVQYDAPCMYRFSNKEGRFSIAAAECADSTLFIQKSPGALYYVYLSVDQLRKGELLSIQLRPEDRQENVCAYLHDAINMKVEIGTQEVACRFSGLRENANVYVVLTDGHLDEQEVFGRFRVFAERHENALFSIDIRNVPDGLYTVEAMISQNRDKEVVASMPRIISRHITLDRGASADATLPE